ncbi:MAG: DNA repair protein RadA [Pseudomonadales bacterium]|jgi:DNA repair protein RadA/Sms|nr:DNA repair protein RadA [Pseudomonadales bacterium]
MARRRDLWICRACGAEHPKWQGQCVGCNEWNSLEQISTEAAAASRAANWSGSASTVTRLGEVDLVDAPRIATGMKELDRVLGGGMVPGSVILIGGNPGAGKSTLLLQVSCELAERIGVLYVTGEESLQQIALRARRLDLPREQLTLAAETRVEAIVAHAARSRPRLLVVDSIQTLQTEAVEGAPGGVTQVREATARLVRFAKESGTVVILVGHVNKEGGLAGPKVLEHMIDTFMMLEDASDSRFRTLRGHKNRFGAVNELGVFAMTDRGLKEVANPSAIFLSRGEEPAAGSLVVVVWEGTRPLLVEVQALVDAGMGAHPRRVTVGIEANRLALLLAVLHRHAGLQLGDQDVFLNVVGGVRVAETASDLAVLLATISSFRDRPLPRELIAFGEVGLSGEVRPVPSGQERLREAVKHGFRRAICPKANVPREAIEGLEIVGVRSVQEALDAAGF